MSGLASDQEQAAVAFVMLVIDGEGVEQKRCPLFGRRRPTNSKLVRPSFS